MVEKYPVFISFPEGVSVTPAQSPVLVTAGESLSVYVSVLNSDDVFGSIVVNSTEVMSQGRDYVVKLENITEPKFVVVRNVGPLTSVVSSDDPCCGIKNVRLSLQEDGSIISSVSGLQQDVYSVMHSVMSGTPSSPLVNNTVSGRYRITAWHEEGHITTVTATSIVNDTFEKIPTSASFKTIPSDIYNLHMSGIITRSMHNPLDEPDTLIYIRSSDLYGTNGWTVQEILDTLRIDAKVPAAFNYHVYQLNITRGAPVISLMYNLLPIPGLVIERKRHVKSSNYIASYYITLANGKGNFSGIECKVLGSSSRTTKFKTTVVGLPGEPRYVDAYSSSGGTSTMQVTYNLIGGVFSIDYAESILHTESNT